MAEVRYLKYNQSKPCFDVNLIRSQNVDWPFMGVSHISAFTPNVKGQGIEIFCCIGLQTTESPLIQHPAEP